jgi:hypothetical protein
MTTTKTLFDMPGDILSKIYQMDCTFQTVFSKKDFKLDLKRAVMKIFIRRSVVTRTNDKGRPQWQYLNHWDVNVDRTKCSFGPEFKIYLHPTSLYSTFHTKYSIVRKDVDTSIMDPGKFDGCIRNSCDYWLLPTDNSDRDLDHEKKVVLQHFECDKVLGFSLFKKDKQKDYHYERYRNELNFDPRDYRNNDRYD